MNESVWVVTNPELGWDSVVAVFPKRLFSKEDLQVEYPEDQYIIQQHSLETAI